MKCAQCGSSNYLDQCPEFVKMPAAIRIDCVERLRVCYLCLKPNHQAKRCRSRHACAFQLCGKASSTFAPTEFFHDEKRTRTIWDCIRSSASPGFEDPKETPFGTALQRMFNFEFIEAVCTKRTMSLKSRVTYDRMLTSLKIVGPYQIPLPWKDGSLCLPDNKGLLLRRLFVLNGRLERG
ncbi:zinc knuckle [Opisthorchis viverrini]|uniref:Zinc knuckle n=1 Tax=Opisthorchis viverrini TaxID=6198 RepID=A0A1S8WJX8_OPIVI|nr:zinc knuckle [Opisthorchis viverrini]